MFIFLFLGTWQLMAHCACPDLAAVPHFRLLPPNFVRYVGKKGAWRVGRGRRFPLALSVFICALFL